MNMHAKASPEAGPAGAINQVLPLRARLSQALLNFSSQMASVKTGALVQVCCAKHQLVCNEGRLTERLRELQVWMPEQCADGTVVLSAQVRVHLVAHGGTMGTCKLQKQRISVRA